MCHKLASLDILAPPISLGLKGNAFLSTKTGGAFSLAAILTFLGLAVYSVIQALRTDKPQVLMEYSAAEEFPAIDIIQNKQIPVILLSRPGMIVSLSDIPQYLHIRMSIKKQIMTSPTTIKYEEIPVKIVPCGKLPAKTLQKFIVDRSSQEEKFILLNNGLCPDITSLNFVLQGKASQMTRTTLEITVYPCVPELLLPNQTCAAAPVLSQLSIYLTQATVNLDLTNYESPMSYSWDSETDYRFAYSQSLRARANMKIVEVRNNEWGLYAEATVASTAQIDTVKTNMVSRDPTQTICSLNQIESSFTCEPLAVFTYTSGRKREIFTRSYSGLLGIAASVGGIRALIFTLFFYFHVMFSSFSVKKRLVELVFGKTCSEQTKPPKSPLLETKIETPCKVTSKTEFELDKSSPSTSAMHEFIHNILDVRNVVQQLCFVKILRQFLLEPPKTRKNSLDDVSNNGDLGMLAKPHKVQSSVAQESCQPANKINPVSPARVSDTYQSQVFKPSILRTPSQIRFTNLIKTPKSGEIPKVTRFEEYQQSAIDSIAAINTSTPSSASKKNFREQKFEVMALRDRFLEEFKDYLAANHCSETQEFIPNPGSKMESKETPIMASQDANPLIQNLMFRASQIHWSIM